MANKMVLPVKYPAITSWQWHATLFSILSSNVVFLALVISLFPPERVSFNSL